MSFFRVSFPTDIGKALFEDQVMANFLERRMVPGKEQFLKFLATQPPLPNGKNWNYVKDKFKSKLNNLKLKDKNKQKKKIEPESFLKRRKTE